MPDVPAVEVPRLAGVIGWPIGHSLSPALHRFWLDRAAIEGHYLPLAVSPGKLESALRGLACSGFAGVNVTVPHKPAALALVDELDPLAARIGAVNLVTMTADGQLRGRNSDAAGFLAHLGACRPDWRHPGGTAILLGAGGAARAIAIALLDAGVEGLVILNRDRRRAEDLAAALDDPRVGTAGLEDFPDLAGSASLLVQATTLGMRGQPPLDIDLTPMPAGATVCDLVYRPLETPLLAAARARGLVAIDGLGMLVHQAIPAFRAFYGAEAVADAATFDFLRARAS